MFSEEEKILEHRSHEQRLFGRQCQMDYANIFVLVSILLFSFASCRTIQVFKLVPNNNSYFVTDTGSSNAVGETITEKVNKKVKK